MWINHLKMFIGTIGLAILVVGGIIMRLTEKDKENFSVIWHNILILWEDMKINIYGG